MLVFIVKHQSAVANTIRNSSKVMVTEVVFPSTTSEVLSRTMHLSLPVGDSELA